jgi:hypothetical protein
VEKVIGWNDDLKIGSCRREQVPHLRLQAAQNVRETDGDFATRELRLNERERQRGLHPGRNMIRTDADIARGAAFEHGSKPQLHLFARRSDIRTVIGGGGRLRERSWPGRCRGRGAG